MSHSNSGFEGKVVVVTGAAGGIGLATALRLAARGAEVYAADLPTSPLAEAYAGVGEMDGRIHQAHLDVTVPKDWQHLVARAEEECGGVDILVNNAGIVEPGTRLQEFSEELFDRVMAVNVKGTFLGIKAVLPTMRKRGGGSIINIASISSFKGNAKVSAYTTSKHAVMGLTKCAAIDLAEYGIRVNAVCPAPIDTPMVRNMEKRIQAVDPDFDITVAMTGGNPMKRLGTPEEVAAAIEFLASKEASFITGSGLAVDGGVLAT